jgi:hypothetical protein
MCIAPLLVVIEMAQLARTHRGSRRWLQFDLHFADVSALVDESAGHVQSIDRPRNAFLRGAPVRRGGLSRLSE